MGKAWNEIRKAWDEQARPAKIAAATVFSLAAFCLWGEIVVLLERWREDSAGTFLFVSLLLIAITAFWIIVIPSEEET
jgi:hypothetical protein